MVAQSENLIEADKEFSKKYNDALEILGYQSN